MSSMQHCHVTVRIALVVISLEQQDEGTGDGAMDQPVLEDEGQEAEWKVCGVQQHIRAEALSHVYIMQLHHYHHLKWVPGQSVSNLM